MRMFKIFRGACVAALFALILVLPALANDYDHNIDYSDTLQADTQYNIYADGGNYWIDLNQEKLFARDPDSVQGISYNGGKKWQYVVIPYDGLDISKVLNKMSNIWLASSMNGKKPTVADKAEGVQAAVIYKFQTINKRPRVPSFMVNFSVYSDNTGQTNGQWVITQKNSKQLIKGLQVAASFNKKTPAETMLDSSGNPSDSGSITAGWGTFKQGEGVNVKGLSEDGKVQKTGYIIRVAPNAATRTPASKPKAITVSGVAKSTKYKADYTKEIIKLKEGASITVDTGEGLLPMRLVTKTESKSGLSLNEYGSGKTDIMGMTLYMWTNATDKKPASAVQEYTLAKRGIITAADLKVSGGKVTVPTKTHAVYNTDKKTWGNMPSGSKLVENTKSFLIRTKATAKGGKESDTTFAASKATTLHLKWGEYAKDKNGIIAAQYDLPEYKGIVSYSAKNDNMILELGEKLVHEDVDFTFIGLHDNTSIKIIKLSELDSDTFTPESDTLYIAPEVTYTQNNSKDENSVTAEIVPNSDGTFIDNGVITLRISGNVDCAARVGFKLVFGEDLIAEDDEMDGRGVPFTETYNEDLSGGFSIRVNVSPDGKITKISELTAGADADIRTQVSAAATSGSSVTKAKAGAGILTISSAGKPGFATSQIVQPTASDEAYTFVYYLSKSAADADADETYSNLKSLEDFELLGNLELEHGNTLLVQAKSSKTSAFSYFIFKVVDGSGPGMLDAHIEGIDIVVEMDEAFGTVKLSDASFVLQCVDEDGSAVNLKAGRVFTQTGSKELRLTFNQGIASTYEDYILTYNGGGSFADTDGNLMRPGSVNVRDSKNKGKMIRFENGISFVPQDIVAPQGFNAGEFSDYTQKIAAVSLNGNKTGKISLSGFEGVTYYAVAKSLWASQNTMEILASGTSLSVALGDYIYFENKNTYYCVQVVKASPAASGDASNPVVNTLKLTRTTTNVTSTEVTYSYSMTADISVYVMKYGYGLGVDQFLFSGSAVSGEKKINIDSVSVSGSRITFVISGDGLESLNSGSVLILNYQANSNGLMDSTGNRLMEFSKAVTLSGF